MATEAPAATEDAVPVSVRERGYADRQAASGFWRDSQRESTPELRWPACIDVYDNMRHQDAQVSSVLRAVTAPILRTAWRLDGTGCRPEVVEHLARDLGLPVVGQGNEVDPLYGRGRFSFPEHLRLALLCLPFGHMVFEQVYTFGDGSNGFPQDGLAHLRKLGPRMHRTIAKWNVARDGGLESIEQYGTPGGKRITLPIDRLVVYVLEREGGDWIGTSLLRAAYKNWILKDRLLRVQTLTVERNGLGIPVYTAAGKTPAELDAGEELAAGVRAGDDSGAALPNGASLELLGVKGALPNADEPIRYHDEQIARAVLAHFLNLGTQTGSWALGSTFAEFFTLSLAAVAELIRETFTRHVIEDLVAANWGPGELAPRLVFDEIGNRQEAIVQAISTLVGAGVLKPDEDLEQFVRTALGLPARSAVPFPPATGGAS